jgi:hypothetical protein
LASNLRNGRKIYDQVRKLAKCRLLRLFRTHKQDQKYKKSWTCIIKRNCQSATIFRLPRSFKLLKGGNIFSKISTAVILSKVWLYHNSQAPNVQVPTSLQGNVLVLPYGLMICLSISNVLSTVSFLLQSQLYIT